jgi:hypothetical protein
LKIQFDLKLFRPLREATTFIATEFKRKFPKEDFFKVLQTILSKIFGVSLQNPVRYGILTKGMLSRKN